MNRQKLGNVKVLATDVDGTLTEKNKKLDCRAIKKIRELEKLGIPVILITGHVFPVVSGLANYIGTSGPVVAEGGAVVGFPWKIEAKLGKNIPRRATHIMERLGFTAAESNQYRHQDQAFHRNGQSITVEKIKKQLEEKSIDGDVFDSGYAVHISPKGINKASGLEKALKLIGGVPRKTAVIGDSNFDLPMYKLCGISAALGNAPPSLKEYSTVTCKGENSKGFVEFVKLIIKATN